MAGLIVPYFAQAQTAAVTIDGVTYRVPLIDSGGRVYTNAKATGASEVKSYLKRSVDPSTVRADMITPTGGKKIRVVHTQMASQEAVISNFELYFGTAANIANATTKAVSFAFLHGDVAPNAGESWPDGAGPVGAVDEVLSMRTGANVTIYGWFVVHYREE